MDSWRDIRPPPILRRPTAAPSNRRSRTRGRFAPVCEPRRVRIYIVDLRNGLYILRYHGPHAAEVADVRFLDGNSNSGDAARLEAGG